MPAITWNDKLVNNVAVIDDQHMKLVEMINAFYSALHEKKPQTALEQLLGGMVDYTQFHFSTEEDFMKKHEYPFAYKHISEHRDFVNKVADWQGKIAARQLVISFEVTTFLKTWLIDHISQSDKNLCKFLNTKGVA
jgi:hemerythrin